MADVPQTVVSAGPDTLGRKLTLGALSGLVGGLLFGVLMGMMGMLPMVATLVGSKDGFVGLIVHLVLSAIIGAAFGLVFGSSVTSPAQGLIWGAVYGFIWWVLGPLLIMPSLMGMGPQFAMAFAQPNMMSLLGHLVYGLAAGLTYHWLATRQA